MSSKAMAFVCLVFMLAGWVAAQEEPTDREEALDRRLIIACYQRNVDAVIKCLRDGADVNATFGDVPKEDLEPFRDHWDGGMILAIRSWTPLLALSASNEYPDPPAELWRELAKTWDPPRVAALRKTIPRETSQGQ